MESPKLKIESYRSRAEELRAVAQGLKDQEARDSLMRIAADYDRMADRIARRLRS